jgi:hypothetical protein
MLLKQRLFTLFSILLILTLACTAPALSPTPSAVSTVPAPVAADTVTAPIETSAEITKTPPLPAETEVPSPTTASAALPNLTPTVSGTAITFPTVTFDRNTNCRVGPSKNYFVQTSFMDSRYTTAEGRNQDSSWLLVKPFEGPNCWVNVSNLKEPGDYSYLPIKDFPPLPEAPFQMVVLKRDCVGRNLITLRWQDVSAETGYRIYREGIMLSSLKMNATQYSDYPPDANSYFYEVESINEYGVSVRFSMSVAGCPVQ